MCDPSPASTSSHWAETQPGGQTRCLAFVSADCRIVANQAARPSLLLCSVVGIGVLSVAY
jgi:hypothetical protein